MNPIRRVVRLVPCIAISALFALNSNGGTERPKLPETDQRAGPPKTTDTRWAFPEINSKREWQLRSREIRQQVLVSCGLWPMPAKTPLQANVFGKIERDGYSVEKVYFQTYPGVYLAGNLYRPLGKGNGPFPAVLNPHGHWQEGRLVDRNIGSIAARCINFARQGMIAFSYDMVGYNDTAQVKHNFARNPTNLLWNISLMGLQTWNSIRALDFMGSLPDVDKKRIGCTGASGGGTQTFILGAIDDRLAAQAPNVMVSHSMQGGCLCENAPGLRVDFSNMEIAAAAAPRPQILVAASGDWTKMTMTVEGPAVEGIYRLFKAPENLRYVRYDFEHNYNQTSREAVYEWFGKCLLKVSDPSSLKETAYTKEPDKDLRVWPDGKMPEDALNETKLIDSMIARTEMHLNVLQPTDERNLERYQQIMLPAWRHVLQVESPVRNLVVEKGEVKEVESSTISQFKIGRGGKGDRVPVVLYRPQQTRRNAVVILAHPEGQAAYIGDAGTPKGIARKLLDRGISVLLLDTFLTGSLAHPAASNARNYFTNYFCTYNRTDMQERVQDLVTACAFARDEANYRTVVLCGAEQAGLWTLLAAPAADGVAADCGQFYPADDTALLQKDLFVPGIRCIGAFAGVASLAAPHPLLVHNTGSKFATGTLSNTYKAARKSMSLRIEPEQSPEVVLVQWLSSVK